MRLYLSLEPTEYQDYTNIHGGEISSLKTVDDSSCTDIIALNVLDYIKLKDWPAILTLWTKKLRHKGRISLTGNDLSDIARSLQTDQLNTTDVNSLLFGNGQAVKQSCLEVGDIVRLLKELGLVVVHATNVNYQWVVMGERP